MIQRKIINVRRMPDRTEESARKRGQKLSKKYKITVIDEFVSANLHIIMANLTEEQIKSIDEDSMVLNIEDPPCFTLN